MLLQECGTTYSKYFERLFGIYNLGTFKCLVMHFEVF